jgi:regulator of replication initiation timing
MKWWLQKQFKKGLKNARSSKKPNIDSFHRSYPLRHRSNGHYHTRKELLTRKQEADRQIKLFNHLQNLEVEMKTLYRDNAKLKDQVKYLVQLRNASKLYNPTPFEREKLTRREKEEKVRKALRNIRTKFDTIRTFVDDTPVQLKANIAQCNDAPKRSFLNIVYSYLPTFHQAEVKSEPTAAVKTVIWDSGSSMSITNDHSEFMPNEYEALPRARTVTGISTSKVKIQGVGMVSWSFEDANGNIRTLELPCLYVPDVKQRLLSTTSLLKQYPNESISMSDGKFTLSGSSTTAPIEAYIDSNNNLPTTILCDPSVMMHQRTAMNSLIAVVAEANQNLSEPEKELLKWHQRLAHIDMNKVKFLFRTGILARSEASRSLQTAASKLKSNPRCAACQFGKQCQASVPTTTQAKVTDKVGAISKDVLRPGQQVCIDHFICRNKGRLFTSRGKTVPTDMYSGGCIFVDSYSGFVHVELQKHMNEIETIEAKERFESMALDYGVIPQTYLSDNGAAFTSHGFASKIKELAQASKFAGAGAHHHNGVAERNIRTIISIARTIMIHAAMHWPEVSDVELWPMAVKHAVHVFNRVPSIETGICPLDKFTSQRFPQNKLHDLHVWGCPVYVLDKRVPDGIKIPKWAPRSNRYIYMGVSDKHSSTVPLVLNPETGVISPQFHVVVDEWFATIATSTGEMPDFSKEEWTKMFGENAHHYIWDENDEADDEQNYLPSPELEAIDRREQRVSTAIGQHTPPVALPVPDPPTTSTRTPTHNRFEPLSTFDDDNFEPTIILQSPVHTPHPIRSSPQREQSVRVQETEVETVRDDVDQVENVTTQVPVQVTQAPVPEPNVPAIAELPSATLPRRSTRVRRAPDRLNLMVESPMCFYIENTKHEASSEGDEIFTYLFSALCSTTPGVQQASTLISSDAFKASIGDPDTLSWDQAMKDIPNLDQWMQAAIKEIAALEAHGTWVIDDQSNATSKILPGTWVFRVKRAPDGTIIKFKARYCVRGDLQTDIHETYAPVVGWSTIRLFLILSLLLHWDTKSIDFSQAFVQAALAHPVWIHLPRGFHTEGTNKCLKLVKSLYGLAEAPRLWYLHLFDALVKKLGFTQSKIDPCLLMKDGIMIVVFVDDCAISYRDESIYTKLIKDLRELNFELTEEGAFSKFLGINFELTGNKIHMTQTGLIDRIAEATGLSSANPNHTPTQQDAIGKDLQGPPMSEAWSYRSVVGMLLYLATNTRPDIAYAVSQVARFSNNPKKSHATAVKTIVRYLVGTRTKGTIVTPTGKLDIKLYVDADFAGLFKREAPEDPDSARSRTGYILILGGFPLIWKSHLQNKIALSTLEAEYSALSSATRALIPIRELLFEIAGIIAIPRTLTTTIRCVIFEDNQGAYLLATTQRISARTRYFTVEFHHFWEFVQLENENSRKIFLEKIDTKHQGADFLTKGQPKLIYRDNRFLLLGW